ncbi:prokaryotic N-terminal methylation motif domain protein [Nautilia profundicola AmH]|uniref:Prokaryotic N-terminal methylation motif domain protein n=1 Tax=Nautilia profundicola (strain ATCC BAA-1463 / DSM 18972 / AmH) TaxID=598659 RepID=B9L751_NAUPA|nr:type II secretion system protein [Nautilia profundicola]ACM92801.1 prokaryotic N-terminal methylation motif domain protein [Nautilia profundicola AmH]
MKKSFTLIEVLISITILSILFLALSNVISSLSKASDYLEKKYSFENNKYLFLKILYYDILNADDINITQYKNYTIIKMQTSNSLYFIPKPYVMWYVSKRNNTLVRYESPKNIDILEDNSNYYLDKFIQNVKIFKIYKHLGKYFVYIDNGKPIYFEMYKGF